MTSRDGSNRNVRRGTNQPQRPAPRGNQGWELDASELDRFITGDQGDDRRFDPYAQQDQPRRRASQPPTQRTPATRSMPTQPAYTDDYADDAYADDAWADDAHYEDDYYEPEPAPRQRRQPPARQQTRRQPDPAYVDGDDDLYDDPFVMDDEEETPPTVRRRRPAQEGRERAERAPRQRPNFQMPTAISQAPFVMDRMALIMAGVVLLSTIATVIVVATQRDALGDIVFTHVNANGTPGNLVESNAVWRMPLIAAAVGIINIALAWFLSRWGNFLPRFLLGGTLAVHFIVWVALIAYFF